ncbi:ABC transporter ATP-binding protein [Uliginosibacterium sediminicola]|jgi:branched-chain amino acid transport system ATP-binding protein|uniref:ABC transporter ATP-binding protein n=1 Tax=Uliginosibacterium sediminicola TaxID=2024550 RepID=A0ABU9YYS2_9RHOO
MAGLQLEGLHKSYGALKVTDDLSFSLEFGRTLGVIGPNGAGKSTLFNLITGVVPPDAGRIIFDGQDITRRPATQRARIGICRSYQVPQPFNNMSVFENLLVGASFAAGMSEREARTHCAQILEQTGLLARANEPAGQLRLLDRKRLEMARALAAKPRLLLLDEIAGGLTDDECQSLLQLIRSIHAQGVAIIWIEHVVHVLTSFVDRLLVLNFGAKLADGTPDAVMADAEVQRVYMGLEA